MQFCAFGFEATIRVLWEFTSSSWRIYSQLGSGK